MDIIYGIIAICVALLVISFVFQVLQFLMPVLTVIIIALLVYHIYLNKKLEKMYQEETYTQEPKDAIDADIDIIKEEETDQ